MATDGRVSDIQRQRALFGYFRSGLPDAGVFERRLLNIPQVVVRLRVQRPASAGNVPGDAAGGRVWASRGGDDGLQIAQWLRLNVPTAAPGSSTLSMQYQLNINSPSLSMT